jgi:hypothetical protein
MKSYGLSVFSCLCWCFPAWRSSSMKPRAYQKKFPTLTCTYQHDRMPVHCYACPCRSNGHLAHGSCDVADFTHISRASRKKYGWLQGCGHRRPDRSRSQQSPRHLPSTRVPARRSGAHSMKCSRSCSDGTRSTLSAPILPRWTFPPTKTLTHSRFPTHACAHNIQREAWL